MNYEEIIAKKDTQILELTASNLDLKHQLEQLRRLIYGRKSERFISKEDSGQLNLFEEGTEVVPETEPEKQTVTYERTRKPNNHSGRRLLDGCSHLPVEEETLDIEHSENDKHIGDEVSEKLAFKPGKLFVKRTIRPKYKRAEDETIVIAPIQEDPISKCAADVSLLAHITVSKFVDHLPEYRIQQIFKREGVVIPPSTMNGWVHQLGNYVKLMSNHIKGKILQSGYVQQDESTIKVLNSKKQGSHTGYMWVMASPLLKNVCFEYHPGRGREGPLETYKDYNGQLQTDAYEVYDIIDARYDSIEHFHCWAHARRKFIESANNDKARSEYAIGQIGLLYDIERRCRESDYTPDQRREERKLAKPILESFKEWLDTVAIKVTPGSPIGKAMAYLIKRWNKFTKYVDYGEVEIDNNHIENAIRPLALGRKNYLFAGNHTAAETIGHYYTIFGTCKAQNVNPYEYMTWFLKNVASTNINEMEKLSPESFKALGLDHDC